MKLELVSTMFAGDGKPWDVATDRILANNFNLFQDAKSCAQNPLSVETNNIAVSPYTAQPLTYATACAFIYPYFSGLERQSATITRVLTVAPRFRSGSAATDAWVRITLTNQLPEVAPGFAEGHHSAQYPSPNFPGATSSSTWWTTSSTTWQIGASYDLPMFAKTDIGFHWIVVEVAGAAECSGLAVCHESARRVA